MRSLDGTAIFTQQEHRCWENALVTSPKGGRRCVNGKYKLQNLKVWKIFVWNILGNKISETIKILFKTSEVVRMLNIWMEKNKGWDANAFKNLQCWSEMGN